jgi:uncharacterized protein (TIGR04255 family)
MLPPGAAGELPIFGSSTTAFDFRSLDRLWQLSLTGDFIALSTKKYERWEQFRERMEAACAALVEEYEPVLFSRVGLRYQNLIMRSALNLNNVPWTELLSPAALAELGHAQLSPDVQELRRETLLSLPNFEGKALVRNALTVEESTASSASSSTVTSSSTKPQNFPTPFRPWTT